MSKTTTMVQVLRGSVLTTYVIFAFFVHSLVNWQVWFLLCYNLM